MPRVNLTDLPPRYQKQVSGQLHGAKLPIMHRECTDTFPGKSNTQKKLEKKISNNAQIAAQIFSGLPAPLIEYRFHPVRKWRIDYFFVRARVGLEVQGGIFIQGRHSRGASLLKEYEKLNEAAAMGIRMLYCTPQQLKKGEILPVLKRALGITTEL